MGLIVVTCFLQKQDMDLVVRAHQVVEDGYERLSLIIETQGKRGHTFGYAERIAKIKYNIIMLKSCLNHVYLVFECDEFRSNSVQILFNLCSNIIIIFRLRSSLLISWTQGFPGLRGQDFRPVGSGRGSRSAW